jgi:hypothetical protein
MRPLRYARQSAHRQTLAYDSRPEIDKVVQVRGDSGHSACAYHLSHPDIFVMESAEEWDCCE